MDETLFYLGVQTPVDDVIAVLHRVLPGGVRSDGTTAQWSGTYRNSGRNGGGGYFCDYPGFGSNGSDLLLYPDTA